MPARKNSLRGIGAARATVLQELPPNSKSHLDSGKEPVAAEMASGAEAICAPCVASKHFQASVLQSGGFKYHLLKIAVFGSESS